MGIRTIETPTDDLDGKDAPEAERVRFALDGMAYQIDLRPTNAERLRGALAEFIGAAQSIGTANVASEEIGVVERVAAAPTARSAVNIHRGQSARAASRHSRGSKAGQEETRVIRAWAKDQGISMSDRGRIPAEVVERYHARDAAPPVRAAKAAPKAAPAFSGS